jgi:phenylacetate-CoA ligase
MSGSLHEAVTAYAAALAPDVARTVSQARSAVPAFDARWGDRAGIDELPILTKDDVLALQAAEPPFGGLIAPNALVRRVFQSPGPLYEPQLDGVDPWRWGPSLAAAGIGPDDLVLNCFGYHLSPAGAMFEEGALALGARVLPGGIGSQDLQARAIADLGVTAYTGLPSYLKAIIDRFTELGLDSSRWQLSKALVTAEPLPDSLRVLLQERVPTVLMAYGTAETGLIAFETEPGGGLVPAPGLLVEICDLDTGMPVTSGEGQVVVTLLRADYPMVRFGTGDLSAWRLGPDGSPRLVGVLGRVGAAVKVRGMFLHPRQAAAALSDVTGVAAWRFLVDRVDHRDELTCEIVCADGADADDVVDRVTALVRAGLRFGCAVTAVPALPEGAGTIVDRRDWS